MRLQRAADRWPQAVPVDRGRRPSVANAVAEHLAFFEGVMASDGTENLKAGHKREALEARFGRNGFDYIGDSAADLAVLRGGRARLSGERVLDDGRPRLRVQGARRLDPEIARGGRRSRRCASISGRRTRLVLFSCAPRGDPSDVRGRQGRGAGDGVAEPVRVGAATCSTICSTSAPIARTPPSAGAPSPRARCPLLYGPPLWSCCSAASFGLAFATLPITFVGMLALYLVPTLAYSLYFKSKLLVDVHPAGLAVHAPGARRRRRHRHPDQRLAAGVLHVPVPQPGVRQALRRASPGHRKAEKIHGAATTRRTWRWWRRWGRPPASWPSWSSACTSRARARPRTHAPAALADLPDAALLGGAHLVPGHRGEMHDDPVKFAITDRRSWLCFGAIGAVAMVARFWP